ncbi:unnamed protein product [Tilletia caries]|nr:unnamed protein product [Tilletia caries]
MYHPQQQQQRDGGPGGSGSRNQHFQPAADPTNTQTSFHHPQQQHQHLMTHVYPSPEGPLSPLDALVRNGKQAKRDARKSNGGRTGVGLSQDLLTRAHSLSRSTSVRTAHPTTVSEEYDGDGGRGPSTYQSHTINEYGAGRNTSLVRKDSVDTVRSSEFGEEGRWAKAWTRRADDEESLFDDSSSQWDAESYRSSDDVGWSGQGQNTISEEEEYLQAQAALKNSSVQVDRSDAGSMRSSRGHPAGRMPPPPPPAVAGGSTSPGRPVSGVYQNPNQPYGNSHVSERDWTASLGKHRAAILAAHDGRASLVSDLDVETLRLDGGSSRRSSTSTIAMSNSRPSSTLPSSTSVGYATDYSQILHPEAASTNGHPRAQQQQPNIRQQPSVGSLSKPPPKPVSTAEELLSRGIEYHEAGDLSRSVFYFERSAKVEGGCVVGMCMYGMALREGWGAKKDQRRGFEWIQAAATRAGEVLKIGQPRTEAEINALKSELKLSVYELGKCYCYGWGVKTDKHIALEYFELAAKLGDADAQAEAGALYATGKGCKKDLKQAARYYRMAEAQGYDTVGLSWIHKEKYL